MLHNKKSCTKKKIFFTFAVFAIFLCVGVNLTFRSCVNTIEGRNQFMYKKIYIWNTSLVYFQNILTKDSCLSNNNRFLLNLYPFAFPIS